MALVPVLGYVLKARTEEREGRAENVLAAVVPRTKFLAGYVIIAFVAAIVFQFVLGVSLYLSAVAVLPNPSEISLRMFLEINLVFLPAVWLMIGVATFLVGVLPKATAAIWGYFGFIFLMVILGRMPGLLPDWVVGLSPFEHMPQLPADEINFLTLGIVTGIGVVLGIVGFVGYNRRDIRPN